MDSTTTGRRPSRPLAALPAGRPSGARDFFQSISFIDRQTGYARSGWGDLWITRDRGVTFAPALPSTGSGGPIDFVSETDGWRWDGRGDLSVTADGGRTWSLVPNLPPVASFDLVAPRAGWAVLLQPRPGDARGGVNGRLLATDDGGRTWTEYDLGAANPLEVFAVDRLHLWLRIEGGALLRSVDGGESWAVAYR